MYLALASTISPFFLSFFPTLLPTAAAAVFVMAARGPPVDFTIIGDMCSAFKDEGKAKFEAVEAFLEEKGLSYQEALGKLIEGSLKPTSLKRSAVKLIVHYIAWKLSATLEVLKVFRKIEYWDEKLMKLIYEVVASINDIKLTILSVGAICTLSESYFSAPDKISRESILDLTKDLVWYLEVGLIYSDEIMKQWAKAPSQLVDISSVRKLRSQRYGLL